MTTPLLMFVLLALPCYSAPGQLNRYGLPVSAHSRDFYVRSPRDHLCDSGTFDILGFTCCEGVLRQGAGQSCCGNKSFNLTQASCCGGQLTLHVSQLVSDCCGSRAYDPLNQLCCDLQILIRTQPHSKCCGKELYNEDHQLCCGTVLQGRKVLTKMSGHHRCCGDHQFDQQSHCCCHITEPSNPKPLNASCCATAIQEVPHPPPAQTCQHMGIAQNSPNCMPGKKPCGLGACFNPTTERCCVNPTSLQGQSYSHDHTPGHYHGASFGSQVYNPDINICCSGKLSNRVLGKSLCCGTTPYGVEDRGVLCCNQTLHLAVEDGYQCSPGGHLYRPSRGMVCGSYVHLNDPGKHCCGEETYDPQYEICCNGHKGCCSTLSTPTSLCKGCNVCRWEKERRTKVQRGFGMLTPSTTEGHISLPGNLRPAGLLCHPLLQPLSGDRHHHVELPHAMVPPEENTQQQAKRQQKPTRGWRRGKRHGWWERGVEALCVFHHSRTFCCYSGVGVWCFHSLLSHGGLELHRVPVILLRDLQYGGLQGTW
ncbi:uncharacterized protein ACWYII_014892 isoform 1-T1 [Salvelinus alpinus]